MDLIVSSVSVITAVFFSKGIWDWRRYSLVVYYLLVVVLDAYTPFGYIAMSGMVAVMFIESLLSKRYWANSMFYGLHLVLFLHQILHLRYAFIATPIRLLMLLICARLLLKVEERYSYHLTFITMITCHVTIYEVFRYMG